MRVPEEFAVKVNELVEMGAKMGMSRTQLLDMTMTSLVILAPSRQPVNFTNTTPPDSYMLQAEQDRRTRREL